MTRWARACGNMTDGGDGMAALTEGEALAWCETRGIDADVIEAHFTVEEA